jgi:hypothetical protein
MHVAILILDLPPSVPITYAPDIPAPYVETITVKSTTTLILNDAVYAKDLLEDIERVRC